MLAIASVICALCARGTPSPYVANKIPHGSAEPYHAPSGAYHECEAFYITRRKALYHVALSNRVRQTTLSTCDVCGNISYGVISVGINSVRFAISLESVAGLQEI